MALYGGLVVNIKYVVAHVTPATMFGKQEREYNDGLPLWISAIVQWFPWC